MGWGRHIRVRRVVMAGTVAARGAGAAAAVAAAGSLLLAAPAVAAPAATAGPGAPAIAVTLETCGSAACSLVRIANAGSATLKIISVTGYDVFVAAECATRALAPGSACE